MTRPCAAGRELVEPADGNRFWSTPCPNEGTDDLLLGPDENGRTYRLALCLAHVIALSPRKLPDDQRWEACASCAREYEYGYLCRTHLLCDACHPPVEPP